MLQFDLHALPRDSAVVFEDHAVLVSSLGSGYATISRVLAAEDLRLALGQDARKPRGVSDELALTVLDSCAPRHYSLPIYTTTVNGSSDEKATFRARLILSLVTRLGPSKRVLLLGAVPSIVKALRVAGHQVMAFDMDPQWRGVDCYDIGVSVGNSNAYATTFPEADVVVATGMTLVNGSGLGLLEQTKSSNKPLVFYCQSLANIAPILASTWSQLAVISEPFPNYFLAGRTPFQVFAGRAWKRGAWGKGTLDMPTALWEVNSPHE
ncbi:MAG: DUF364 domain-containing protein [Kineosporiaceae bacterium]